MKKNDRIRLEITDIGINGEGIGRKDGYAFFVKDAVVGDEVEAVITKMNKSYGFAKALEIIKESPKRVKPVCPNAARCGGCQIMQMDYKAQLKFKENKVKNNLERLGGQKDFIFDPIIGMEGDCPLHFRNKVQFPVGRDKDGRVVAGFYAGRTHFIVESENCPVSAAPAERALRAVIRFIEDNNISVYDEKSSNGLVRHVLIRTSRDASALMLCLVINGDKLPTGQKTEKTLVRYIREAAPEAVSICLNINKKNTNVILGNKTAVLYGNEYLEDKISDLTFHISPLSFFQVNPIQTEKLYAKALEYAALSGTETVWDLYCGIGTISLFLARAAKEVHGVEIVPAAIENAVENAKLNGITNAAFTCGASEKVFPEAVKAGAHADVVVVDPPRKGCDKALLDAIMEVAPDRIVYVSCDSATLARDIKILSSKYKLVCAAPVDMFPHTVHVETCVLLTKASVSAD